MLFDKGVLHAYSEFLDQQGLVIGDGNAAADAMVNATPRKHPGEDKRSHEQLVEDFLASQREPWDEGVMPPGWHLPDQQLADAEMKMATLQRQLQDEQRERVEAQRMLKDRAHYVPRENFDAAIRRLDDLDKAYARCRADHLNAEEKLGHTEHALAILKTKYNEDTARLREQLTKAYAILAGAYPPLPDAGLARVLYQTHPERDYTEDAAFAELEQSDQDFWGKWATDLRAKWSTVEAEPMSYDRLAKEWGTASREMIWLETIFQERVPGLERRFGEGEVMGPAETVRALLDIMASFVQFGVRIVQSVWPAVQTHLEVFGYAPDGTGLRHADPLEYSEPTQPAQLDLSGVLAERLRQTKQRASEAGAEPLWTAQPEETFSESSGGQGGREKLSRCQHALSRLRVGLEREGISNAQDEDSVDTALRVIQGWGNAHLGLATTKTLLEELAARGNSNGWPVFATRAVQKLLDGLDEDELTYKTVSGRSARG